MKIETAKRIYKKINDNEYIQNLIAQSDSRYILFDVGEHQENFPSYSSRLDHILTGVAISYLSVGCTFAEAELTEESIEPFEKGATILENIFSPKNNRNEFSSYFIVASVLAFYAAKQYSRSFVLLKNLETDTEISKLIFFFFRERYKDLDEELSYVFLSGEYNDTSISDLNNEMESNGRVYVLIFSKALANLVEFIYSGRNKYLQRARECLKDLLEILSYDAEPSFWWVIRLFIIIVDGFEDNSLWNNILPQIDGDDEKVKQYIRAKGFQKNPVVQLFYSQKLALSQIFQDNGSVISMPTSSGKTLIAELTILDCLTKSPDKKVLYLAPFKSLAFEVEESLTRIFRPLGFEVSHLYGGQQYSKLDEMVINSANVIVATSEKSKAIFRSNPDFRNSISLVIIDEGHLLGPEERYILSELFIEELRIYLEKNHGKLIVLSAMLPNAEDIADWVTGNRDLNVQADWRPSKQRLGVLEYTGKNANIHWQGGKVKSFNRGFIEPFIVKRPRSEYIFPNDKKQAIASVALKLSQVGSVLIYTCRKNMVLTQAEEVLVSMGKNRMEYFWPDTNDWKTFQMVCDETYGKNSKILRYAKYGILCHHSGLQDEVRLLIEKLIRNGKPKVIIATSTLAQGVNIGVSTVIIANVWFDKIHKITHNDFWNIAGRAGRSYVDREGKVLFSIDSSRGKRKYSRDLNLAGYYFRNKNKEKAISGLLYIIKYIWSLANKLNISFDRFLQMIADDNYLNLSEDEKNELRNSFDLIDDTLLALDLEFNDLDEEYHSKWVDQYLRRSLAFLQVKYLNGLTENDVISFLQARNYRVKKIAGDPSRWAGLVASSVPLQSGIYIRNQSELLLNNVNNYLNSGRKIEDLYLFLKNTVKVISLFPSGQFEFEGLDEDVVKLWIDGESIANISEHVIETHNNYFTYKLPWGINAIARTLSSLIMKDQSEAYENLAVLVQIGVPNILAAKIYLMGIKSRIAAKELSQCLDSKLEDIAIRDLRVIILNGIEKFSKQISTNTLKWINQLKSERTNYQQSIIKIPNFILENTENGQIGSSELRAKSCNGQEYLCSPDYEEMIPIKISEEFPFDKVSNNLGVYFLRNNSSWSMQIINPYLK